MYLLLTILRTIKLFAHIDIFKIVKRTYGQEIIKITRNLEDLISKHHKIKLDINFIKKMQTRRFDTYLCNGSSSNKTWDNMTQKENRWYNNGR